MSSIGPCFSSFSIACKIASSDLAVSLASFVGRYTVIASHFLANFPISSSSVLTTTLEIC